MKKQPAAGEVRRIQLQVPRKVLRKDLERYRLLCLQLGASDAKVIPADQVVIDERVLLKCMYPKCDHYGTSANCPPHAATPQQMERVTAKYRYGIFYTIQTPPGYRDDERYWQKVRKLRYRITTAVEAEAFRNGHHLALGFAGGSCQVVFCPKQPCAVLQNQSCRAPLMARSAMEAVGMDAFTMAARVGWEIYPIGTNRPPENVSFRRGLGLILIA